MREYRTNDECFIISSCSIENADTIAQVFKPYYSKAKLLAAAPELLKALENLSEAIRSLKEGKRDGGTMGNISLADDAARELIKKVRGE